MHKVGLIGAGTMGGVHAQSYVSLSDVRLAAIYDVCPENATALADRLGLAHDVVVSEVNDILDDKLIDVISICVPTPWHREMVIKAAQAGKHIFCEKPLARTLDDAKEMVSICSTAGVRLMIGHVVRFFPEYSLAKSKMDSGAIGQPGVVRTSRIGQFPRAWNDWYANFEWSGGTVLDLMIHDIDWCCWCLGKPVRVYAKGLYEAGLDHFDYSLVTIRFESGAIAHLEGSWAYPGPFTTKLEVAGSAGLLDHQSSQAIPIKVHAWEQQGQQGGVALPESPLAESPYLVEDRHFFQCIDTGEPFRVSPEDAVTAVSVALAAIESMKTGSPVSL